jgi:ATP-binding cassette subfamily F protein 3
VSILTAVGLSKHFGAQDVFDGVSVQIAHGDRIGLVGANGTGKTTLLRILVGLEVPSNGQVFRARGLRVGYLTQEVTLSDSRDRLWEKALSAFEHLQRQAAQLRLLEDSIANAHDTTERDQLLTRYGEAQAAFDHAGGYTYEQRIRRVLSGLGFAESDYACPLARLSGGQQTRAHLAYLLLNEPDLLLLDEPTNHLDLAAMEWLEDHLQAWPGSIVMVAHDRYFLDSVTTKIWALDRGRLHTYRGNYSAYVAQRADLRERQRRELERQQEFIAREEEFIRRNIAGQHTRQAQGRRKRLERIEPVERVFEDKRINLDLSADLHSGGLVLATHDLVVGYEMDQPLFACPDLEIRRGDRVALLGPNGAGKTTFVKTVLREIRPLGGRVRIGAAVEIGYFAQAHAGLTLSRSVLEEILSVKNLPLGEARNTLGQFLFSGDDVFKRIEDLSGGERARVALAKLALQGANFLVLDEPANHLDIPSQEILQTVLSEFRGTILLVSHDRFFVDALATQIWALEDGHLYVTRGGYGAYLAGRQARRVAAGVAPAGKDGRPDRHSRQLTRQTDSPRGGAPRRPDYRPPRKRGQYRQQQALADLELAIQTAEARLAELATALEEASRYQAVERVAALGRDYQATEQELTRLFDQWAELEAA